MTTTPYNRIAVSTLPTPPIPDKPYQVIGCVSTDLYDADSEINIYMELQKEAYDLSGDNADAVIGITFETTGYVRKYEIGSEYGSYDEHYYSHTYSRAYGTVIQYIEE